MPVYIFNIVLTVAENIRCCWEVRVTHATNTADLQYILPGRQGRDSDMPESVLPHY